MLFIIIAKGGGTQCWCRLLWTITTSLEICVPGSVHDAGVLANSTLFRKVTNDDLLQGDKEQVGGQELTIDLIGDFAYPPSS